jgi:hypothetical protein
LMLAASQIPDATVSGADREAMRVAAMKCGLTNWDVSFAIYPSAPFEPSIHIDPAATETQFKCVLENLPKDFSFRFGMNVEINRKP